MPFNQLTPRTFTSGGVQMYAPSAAGVYGISNAREWVFIGQADNIRGALLAHLREPRAPLMKRQPTGFVFEICEGAQRSTRQDRLILEYGPACNQTSPPYS